MSKAEIEIWMKKLYKLKKSLTWMRWYLYRIDALETKLVGKYTSSIIVIPEDENTRGDTESLRRSSVNDEMNAFKKQHARELNYHETLIKECQEIIDKVADEYRWVFVELFVVGEAVTWIAMNLEVSRQHVYRIVRRELEKIG